MRWLVFAILVVHGLIHLLGVARAFGGPSETLGPPLPKTVGLLWLAATVGLLLAAGLLAASSRSWWSVGAVAVVLSQLAIATAWSDARFGTIVNVVLLLFLAQAFAAQGPWSLRSEYRGAVAERLAETVPAATITEDDVARLPELLQRYLRVAGAVGGPRVGRFQVSMRGRIRGGPGEAWMPFTATQLNTVAEPSRLFFMDARRGGLPVDVFHAFADGRATMRVRLLSLMPIARAEGPELTRAETVTLFNDLCVMAPAALLDAPVRWEAVDDRTLRGHYTVGTNTVTADLVFDDAGALVDFRSEDRLKASADGGSFERLPWSTPLRGDRDFGQTRVASFGEARWHTPDGSYAYLEMEITEVVLNRGQPSSSAAWAAARRAIGTRNGEHDT